MVSFPWFIKSHGKNNNWAYYTHNKQQISVRMCGICGASMCTAGGGGKKGNGKDDGKEVDALGLYIFSLSCGTKNRLFL